MKSEFYIVLSSDNSLKYFHENNPSHFIARLPYEIQLQGKYKVALVDIHFPQTCLHISQDSKKNWIEMNTEQNYNKKQEINFTNELRPPINLENNQNSYFMDIEELKSKYKSEIQHGIYNNVHELLDQINNLSFIKNHLKFKIAHGGYVKISKICKEHIRHTIGISQAISQILGSTTETHVILNEKEEYTFKLPATLHNALPSELNIYSNLCEPYITGDAQTSLLRRISFDRDNYNFGSYKTKEFAWLKYIPLRHTDFQTIEIDIRDQHGQIVSFVHGTLTVTLHFKKTH